MPARVAELDSRYGRTPVRRRRSVVSAVVAAAVLAAAVIAWSVWTGVGGSSAALDESTTNVQVEGSGAVVVGWTVSGRPGTRLVCALEAQDTAGSVVGLDEIVLPATGQVDRSGTTRVRTVRQASTGLIDSCRDA